MKKVTILNFSARNLGNCANVAAFIADYHKSDIVNTYTIDNRIGPCGGCDYECLKPQEICPRLDAYLNEVMKAVIEGDLSYFIVPNFCGFPCANYLAFNERSVGYFNMDRELMGQYMDKKKKFIIVSNSENQMFDQAMRQQTSIEPDVLYLKSGKYGKRSIAGDILTSDTARADLAAFLAERASE